jgi:hypothetical protein
MPSQFVSRLSIPVATGTATQTSTVQLPVTFQEGNGQIATGTVPVSVTYNAPVYNTEKGFPFLSGAPTFGDFHDATQTYAWGASAAVGLIADDGSSVEFSGYYLPQHSSGFVLDSPHFTPPSSDITNIKINGSIPSPGGAIISTGSLADAIAQQLPGVAAGRLNLLFINAPAGFEGNHGLWTEADRVTVDLKTTLGNAEANYRLGTGNILRPMIGFRYLDQDEEFSIRTEDDVFTNPNPLTTATYTVHTHNRIAAGQLGLEIDSPILRCVQISGIFKGAWGPNILTTNVSLVRGDGLVGFDTHRNLTTFGQIYEAGVYLDFYFLERARLHAGYSALWIPTMARSFDQVDYDLSHTNGNPNYHRGEFYHGPIIELQFLF